MGPIQGAADDRTSRPERRNRAVRLLLALALGATGLLATAGLGGPGAGAVPVVPTGVLWEQVREIPDGVGGLASIMADMDCPVADVCVAVGSSMVPYAEGPVVATSAGGVWGPSQAISVNSLPSAAPIDATATAVDCTGVGDCVMVGDFKADDGSIRPFAATSTGGYWSAAVAIDVSSLSTGVALLWDLSCSSAGNCTAVGRYRVAPDLEGAWTVSSTGGSWGSGRAVVFSGSAGASGSRQATNVACLADGACTVAGDYEATGASRQVFITTSSSGTWSDAERLTLPPDAAPDPEASVGGEIFLNHGLVCTAVQVCTMVGVYQTTTAGWSVRPFVTSSIGGAFAPAQGLSFPPGYAKTGAFASGVSCPTAGTCMAAGWVARYGCFDDPNCVISPFVATSSGGVWSTATPLATTDEIAARSLSGALDVSCAGSTDDCAVVGLFESPSGDSGSMAATRIGGEWSLARRVAGPEAPGTPESETILIDVECFRPGRCTALGFDQTGDVPVRAVAVEAWPMPSTPGDIRTTTAPNSRTVTVSWTAPVATPSPTYVLVGPVPESYQVRCETGGGDPVFVGVAASPARVNLPAGATARCGVRARYGTSVPDDSFRGDWFEGPLGWSNTVTVPVSGPDAPTGVTASNPSQPSGRSTAVTFALPPNVSGAPVTDVETRCTSTDGGATRTVHGLTSPRLVDDLTVGRTYRCAVRATNRVGSSAWVGTNSIVVPAGPPTTVRVAPTGRYGAATVTFSRASGGPAPTTYRVRCTSTDGGTTRTLVKSGAPYVVEGLTKGRTYRCTVTALFGATAGPTSDPSPTVVIP